MHTIGQVSKRFGLSRSTLLYYDSIGLLVPQLRSSSNYRLYSDKDIQRMEFISLYRKTGLPLDVIAKILTSQKETFAAVLEKQLNQLNQEISQLRNQQQLIVKLLENNQKFKFKNTRVMNKERWVGLLRATGLDEALMQKWHVEFEKMSPDLHQDFLESLGISVDEIALIRKNSLKNSWLENNE
ncbi:MAG: MerR family transcriptional regulator [Candidatus Parabeggiatoa sp. nov. 3]|nr:MAG: MerR family transcriptional regulator [Gammaproteobacteria bacterium]RKZ64895.1 MAG: MerR family transcriptional regulator [Gammaproteobacteria bacterium]RKZ88672.1 MAG: MerR family transcriptional regulator [Gammaproteobacteria bacterium]